MIHSHLGETAALITAICWTITSLAFESAGKKVGSLSVNLIRLLIAFILLAIYNQIVRGNAFPSDASLKSWGMLSISGVIGFVIGDLFLFQAFVEIGSRISMLIMASVPPITALTGFVLLGEKIKMVGIVGMMITILGIAMVILTRSGQANGVKFSHPIKGLLFAFIGALGQAFGLVFSKLGMGDYDAFAATQIRIIAAIVGFSIVFTVLKKWGDFLQGASNRKAMERITIGAIFGPFVGVSMSLVAVQHASTGIVSTITSITPILLIPPAVIIFHEKITVKEIIGAVITMVGVALLFI